ncbi:MAG: membrane protein insertase YidC, partial [Actinomycetota bacterium]|nr:membrane protein insertase YidC [Actinomycetota bacterium]
LFTLTVMLVLAPLTVKSTRSMLAMQRLQPEVQRLKQKHQGDKMAQQQAQMDLFKSEGINPAGGCLPMFIQLPVFLVLYRIIQGLTKKVMIHGSLQVQPNYISHGSLLYKHLIAAHGSMVSFGVNLAKSATSSHGSVFAAIPFYLLLVVCIGLQFLQMRQLSSRSPKQTGTAAQTQAIMKFMPLIFGVIYLTIPAGVNVYFLVSSLFRVAQQELMYRYDPQVKHHAAAVKEEARTSEKGVVKSGPADVSKSGAKPAGGLMATLRAARADLVANAGAASSTTTARSGNGSRPSNGAARSSPTARSTTRPNSATRSAAKPGPNGNGAGGVRPASLNGANQAKSAVRTPGKSQAADGLSKNGKTAPPRAAPPKSARSAPALSGSPARPRSASNGSSPKGGKAPAESPEKQAATSGSSDLSARKPAAPQRAGTTGSTGAGRKRAESGDNSWARRPREAAKGSANGASKGGEARPAGFTGVATSAKTGVAATGGAGSTPNRSRAKRARRTR